MQADLFTIGALCARYDVQPITIRRWIAKGAFPPPVRLGRQAFWLKENIERFERTAAEVAASKTKLQIERVS